MFDIRKIQEQMLFNAVKTASDAETASTVVYGKAKEDDATWVNGAMARLSSHFDQAAVKQIRINCQCSYGMDEKLKLVEELKASASNLEEFAAQEKAKAAGLACVDGELYLTFYFCPCPMLTNVEHLETNTWCQCTTGYSKVLFEKAFGCNVDVELLKSIKRGDPVCQMRIVPRGTVWK